MIDSGRFDWGKHGARFPQFVEPSEGYHGLKFWETFGSIAFAIRMRVEILRDVGAALNPFSAQQLLLGLETLSLRSERHASNALALAKWLQKSEHVSWVSYPGLEDHPSYAIARKYLPRGFGGVLSVGIIGGAAAGSQVVDSFKLISNLAKYVVSYHARQSSVRCADYPLPVSPSQRWRLQDLGHPPMEYNPPTAHGPGTNRLWSYGGCDSDLRGHRAY